MRITIHKDTFEQLVRSRKLLIGAVIVLIIIIFFFALNTINAGKLNWGMKIGNISVSGLYPNEAKELLQENSESFLKKEFFLNYKDYYWQTTAKKLGVELDIDATINQALYKKNILWQIVCIFSYKIEPIWTINQEDLENYFQTSLSSIHGPAQNASLVYNKKIQNFDITPSKRGVVIDKEKFKKELTKNINNFQENDIKLFLINDYPEVLESETEQAKRQAIELLENVPIEINVLGDKIDVVNKDTLLDLMDFGPENGVLGIKFPEEKMKAYLVSLGAIINREPVDAKLTIKNGRVTTFALSQDGVKLEIQENISILTQGILNKAKSVELKTIKIKPKITTDSIDNMGITALLAKGESNFSGSPNNRIHNIGIGAARFSGILIKPDEEFSFNDILGEVGPEQGYLPELVIKKDKTIPEYGGGLCQVSTTMFRAVIRAGLKITQRYPHAFPVKYYDPQGFDATIYPPFPDLRFINNTPGYILIQTRVEGYKLIFEFYGTNDNRKVVIDGPYQYDIQEDGSMKASLTQKVYDKNGDILIDKTFYSNYKSPNLYPVQRNPLE